MSATSRFPCENADELPRDMQELAAAIAELPAAEREQIDGIFQHVVASTRRRRRILDLVQESLSQLRLDMKYLVFDLEATRRERDQFRRSLEDQGRPRDQDGLDGTDWPGQADE